MRGDATEQGVNRFRSGATNTSIADKRSRLVGDDHIQRIMILALAMRHSVERPAISMEGGTLILWSGLAHRRLILPLKNTS